MLTLAILAGGKSDRMGQDKALMSLLGRPLIQHVIERLGSLADEIIISTNSPADYAFLGLSLVEDFQFGKGPLAGLNASLIMAKYPFVAAVACDMPFASRSLFEYELDFIVKTEADVAIPVTESGLEPLHAIYQRETCLPAVQTALDGGSYKLIDWLSKVNTRMIPHEVVLQFDPSGLAFRNINTPEELMLTENLARSKEE
jgi:molybdopterin-guanine dinucleotide biosynthesis protein A